MSCVGGPAVTFVYTDWTQMTGMTLISQPAAQNFFNIATLFVNNKLGPVKCPETLTSLLYLATAHLAFLLSPRDNSGNPSSSGTNPAPTIVGRISSATEGSVTVQTEFAAQIPMAAAWWLQSQWGAMFWQATAIYRVAKYFPGTRRPLGFGQTAWLYPNGS